MLTHGTEKRVIVNMSAHLTLYFQTLNVCYSLCMCVYLQGLYMDAVQLFPERVQEFLDLMTEKELRLRVPMEEVDILLED